MKRQIEKLFDLSGKTAIITGAGSGLGKSIAIAYSVYGANVAVVDINKKHAKATVEEIKAHGGNAISIGCNVANIEDVKLTVAAVISQFNQIDILVNSAGIARRAKCEDMSDDDWESVIDINLKGTFHFCREVGKDMIKNEIKGRIINISSIAGVVGIETGNANYSASKGGINAMTRCLAIEWAKHGILVNAIVPSHMMTPIIEGLIKEKPESLQYFINNIPLGRLGKDIEIIGPALFLASEASSFVTGHLLMVDGGHTAK